uniref:Uncharacterized protein n=1 Tax=viral metagenome TaxID=1070528 RepID=A0A6C0JV76_9ZZZZ
MTETIKILLLLMTTLSVLYVVSTWVTSVVIMSTVTNCAYWATCSFSTVNDTCFLSVDNRTITLDKHSASASALYSCVNNLNIKCFYANSRDAIGESLGDYYKTGCRDRYYEFALGNIMTSSVFFIPTVALFIAICIIWKRRDNNVSETQINV